MSVGELKFVLARGQNLVLFELLVFYPLVERLMYMICFTVDGILLVFHCKMLLYVAPSITCVCLEGAVN